jgi:hypothetical protein
LEDAGGGERRCLEDVEDGDEGTWRTWRTVSKQIKLEKEDDQNTDRRLL